MPMWDSIVIVHILSYILDEWNNLYHISFIRINAAQNSSDEIAIIGLWSCVYHMQGYE